MQSHAVLGVAPHPALTVVARAALPRDFERVSAGRRSSRFCTVRACSLRPRPRWRAPVQAAAGSPTQPFAAPERSRFVKDGTECGRRIKLGVVRRPRSAPGDPLLPLLTQLNGAKKVFTIVKKRHSVKDGIVSSLS